MREWIVFDLIGVLAGPSWRDVAKNIEERPWEAFKTGKISEEQFWTRAEGETYRNRLKFDRNRLNYIQRLRKSGYKICVATNFHSMWFECLIAKANFMPFNLKIISSEIGCAKPDDLFWLELLRYVPKGTVFVDDKIDNCIAASHFGFHSISIKAEQNLDDVLDLRGFLD